MSWWGEMNQDVVFLPPNRVPTSRGEGNMENITQIAEEFGFETLSEMPHLL